VSTRAAATTVLVLVSARTTLSAGPVHMILSASEGPAPGTWRYTLHDGQHNRAVYGRVAGKVGHMDVLQYAAGICAAGYQPGAAERGSLEQFAASP
jgi:hypothetical protein